MDVDSLVLRPALELLFGVGLTLVAAALAARRGRPEAGVLGTLGVVGASVAPPFGGRGAERGADGVEGAGIAVAG